MAWKELLFKENKFEEKGYGYVELEKILGLQFYVLDYELYESSSGKPGVRILLEDAKTGDSGMYVSTSATVIARLFRDQQTKIKEFIDQRVPVKFVTKLSTTGNKYITVDD